MCFKTISGSTYTVDTINKTVSGGNITTPLAFTNARCIVGSSGIINLVDGRTIVTSTIISYI